MVDWKTKLKVRLPAFCGLVITILFWVLYDPYEPDGPVLLEAPLLADGTQVRGDVTQQDGVFVLQVNDEKTAARITFPLVGAEAYDLIRVRGRIQVDGVVRGPYPWRCGRLLLLQYTAANRWIPCDHGLTSERGTSGWKAHEKIFKTVPEAHHVALIIEQSGIAGTARFDRLYAEPVQVRASLGWWRIVFGVGWLAAAAFYFPRCRLHRRPLKVLIVLNAVIIIAGSLMPKDWIGDGAERVKMVWSSWRQPPPVAIVSPEPPQTPDGKPVIKPVVDPELQQMDRFNKLIDEVHQNGHTTLFAMLCFLVCLSAALERQRIVFLFKAVLDVLLFAAITESLQHLTIDRRAGVGDWLNDVYGVAIALALFLILLPLISWWQRVAGLKRAGCGGGGG